MNEKHPSGPPILRHTYTLNLQLHRRVHSFPRQHRFSIGQELTQSALALLKKLVEANAHRDSAARLAKLEESQVSLAVVRITLRLAYDLRCFAGTEHTQISIQLEEVGKQLHGWVEFTRKNLVFKPDLK
jgi:four helix bundle protein